MHEFVENRISNGFFSDNIIPIGHWQLAGNKYGSPPVPILNKFLKVQLFLLIQMS